MSKCALVTGATKGIGLAIAESLIHEGWHVGITGRNGADLEAALKRLNEGKPGSALGWVADVRDFGQQQKALDGLLGQWGKLDALIANAGLGHFAAIDELSDKHWHETIDTNLTGVYYSVKVCVEALKKSKGYIITIGSLAGTNFFAGGSAYNASKFGLLGFSQAIMLDLRPYGIKVSTIMPGSVATAFNHHQPTAKDSWMIQPADIAELVIDVLNMNPRTLPSRIEVRPSLPMKS